MESHKEEKSGKGSEVVSRKKGAAGSKKSGAVLPLEEERAPVKVSDARCLESHSQELPNAAEIATVRNLMPKRSDLFGNKMLFLTGKELSSRGLCALRDVCNNVLRQIQPSARKLRNIELRDLR